MIYSYITIIYSYISYHLTILYGMIYNYNNYYAYNYNFPIVIMGYI